MCPCKFFRGASPLIALLTCLFDLHACMRFDGVCMCECVSKASSLVRSVCLHAWRLCAVNGYLGVCTQQLAWSYIVLHLHVYISTFKLFPAVYFVVVVCSRSSCSVKRVCVMRVVFNVIFRLHLTYSSQCRYLSRILCSMVYVAHIMSLFLCRAFCPGCSTGGAN